MFLLSKILLGVPDLPVKLAIPDASNATLGVDSHAGTAAYATPLAS